MEWALAQKSITPESSSVAKSHHRAIEEELKSWKSGAGWDEMLCSPGNGMAPKALLCERSQVREKCAPCGYKFYRQSVAAGGTCSYIKGFVWECPHLAGL